MKTGQCFTFKFNEDNIRGYFFTGITEEEDGQTIYVMCEMVAPHQMTENSFWRMTEDYFNENISNGTIELI